MPIILIICILAIGGAVTYFTYPSALATDNDFATAFNRPRADYADGTYSANVSYTVPNGHVEDVVVTLTLDDAVIVDTEFVFNATNGTSEQYQGRFTDWHEPEVVGKSINEVSLSRLGGASLTSEAFNRALLDIKQQAAG